MSAAEEDKIRTAPNDVDGENTGREDYGKLQYGCDHYRRRCKIRAPCCNRVFTCRYCHNETMERSVFMQEEASVNPEENHALNRHDVKQVICAICNAEQEVAQLCSNCGVKFGEYFCDICKLFDDDKTKDQFHCNDCGICRVGGRENFFHCSKCGSCYSMALQDNHLCIENSMKNDCPICYEFLFDSLKVTTILKCGHSMHMECYTEMMRRGQYRCPFCFKSATNLSSFWERLDKEIEAEPKPESYHYKVFIFCNDCNKCSKANFHRFGLKCGHCSSYNTRRTKSEGNP